MNCVIERLCDRAKYDCVKDDCAKFQLAKSIANVFLPADQLNTKFTQSAFKIVLRPSHNCRWLVDRPDGSHLRIELDLAESLFVLRHVLSQYGEQRLGLLRAQVDALEILHFHLYRRLLLQRAEDHAEIPHG